jgi:hypothetical protein
VVLAEIGSRGFPPATAYRIEHALRRVGIRSTVEVFREGAQLSDYHRRAMDYSRRVTLDEPERQQASPPPERQPAPPPAQQQEPRRPSSAWREQRRSQSAPPPPPPPEPPKSASWSDATSELEQSEPVAAQSGSYPVKNWRTDGPERSASMPRPPRPQPQPEPEPESSRAAEPPEISRPQPQETTGIIEPISAAGPALASVDDVSSASSQSMPRPERPEFPQRRSFGRRGEAKDGDRGIRAVPSTPSTPESAKASSASDADLNEQEKDLLRQLQEELAKRERTDDTDKSQWRTDRSAGRHSEVQGTKWTANPGPRMVNGVQPGARGGGGDQPPFPPSA